MADPTILRYARLGNRTFGILAAFEAAEAASPPSPLPLGLTYEDLQDWICDASPADGKFLQAAISARARLTEWVGRAKVDGVLVGSDPEAGRGRGKQQRYRLTAEGRWLCRLAPHPGAV